MIKRLVFLITSLSLLVWGILNFRYLPSPLKPELLEIQKTSLNEKYNNIRIIKNNNSINIDFDNKTLHFDLESYTLKRESQMKLLPLIQTLDPRNNVTIAGHTCDLGGHNYNLELSQKRAESVKEFIQYKKPSIENIHVVGYEELYPIVDGKDEGIRKLNRRIEIILEDKAKEKILDLHSTGSEASPFVATPAEDVSEGFGLLKLLKKFSWLVILIGLIASILSIFDIVRNWNR